MGGHFTALHRNDFQCTIDKGLYSLYYSCEGNATQHILQNQAFLSTETNNIEINKADKSTNTDIESPTALKLQELRELEANIKKNTNYI